MGRRRELSGDPGAGRQRQVLLSPRPRHLLTMQMHQPSNATTSSFMTHFQMQFGSDLNIQLSLGIPLDVGVLQIIGMYCYGEHQNTKGKALHCLTHSWHCIWSCEEIIGPCLWLPHAAASAHNQSTRPLPPSYLKIVKLEIFTPTTKHIFSLGLDEK